MYICEGPRLRTALSSIYSWEGTVSGLLLTECTFTKDSVSALLWTAPYRMYICEGQRLRTALCLWTAPYRWYFHEGQRLRTTLDCSLRNVHLRRTTFQECSFKCVSLRRELSLDSSLQNVHLRRTASQDCSFLKVYPER